MPIVPAILAAFLFAFSVSASSPIDVVSETLEASVRRTLRTELNEIAIRPVSDDPAIHQTNPVIASNGESFLVVRRESANCCFWHWDTRGYSETIGALYAARFDHRGNRLGEPTLLSQSATIAAPGLAFDGTNYVVVWADYSDFGSSVMSRRLAADGTPVDAEPYEIVRSYGREMTIAVACGANDCLTMFDGGHALLSKHGGVLRLSRERELGGLRNALVSTSNTYAGTTIVSRELPFTPSQQMTTLYAHAYAVLQHSEAEFEGPFLINFPEAPWYERISSSITSSGSDVLIATVDAPSLSWRVLYLNHVHSTGVGFSPNRSRLEVPSMDGYPSMIRDPQIVWNGRRFLIVYQRSNEVNFRPDRFGETPRGMTRAEITGMWIEPDGTPEGPSFDITSTEEIESLPALAADENGLIALAFVRGREASVKSRLFVRMLSDSARTRRPARR